MIRSLLTTLFLLCNSSSVLAGHQVSALSDGQFSEPKRGFILAATKKPVRLLSNTSELGILLGRLCDDLEASVVVVVGSEDEVRVVQSYLVATSCESGRVRLEQFQFSSHTGLSWADEKRPEKYRALRRFKVAAIKNHWTAAGEEVIYLDNDALPRRGTYDALFATFRTMRKNGLSIGFREALQCEPRRHRVEGIPHSFCEYNGGVSFFRGTGASSILGDWLAEFKKDESVDGHDQVSLRRVLYRHRSELYTLPMIYNCRKENETVNPECLISHYGAVSQDELKTPRMIWQPSISGTKAKV